MNDTNQWSHVMKFLTEKHLSYLALAALLAFVLAFAGYRGVANDTRPTLTPTVYLNALKGT
jgi:hypothetical protein